MPELHFPWLELSILVPLLGAAWVWWKGDGEMSRRGAIAVCALTFLLAAGEWLDFATLRSFEAHDPGDVLRWLFHRDVFVVDQLSAPLLPLAALLYLVTILSTSRTKAQRFSFASALLSEAILLATFSCRASWTLVALLALATVPPWVEMRRRGRCTRVYTLHMGVFAALLISGWALLRWTAAGGDEVALVPAALLTAAALLRSGIVPVHCWMSDLFEKVTFGTALLFVTPLSGAYAVMRLVLPIAPDQALQAIALISLGTAIYAGAMALVQREARRFFCYLFLSHSSLVLVGMELATPIGFAGALCVWLSVGIALTGLGLTLRCVEARIGRVSLADFHGLSEPMPTLAGFFLLTGLASIGFPATVGFVGMELLIEGALAVYPLIGTAVALAAALNGIAIVLVYFRIFAGRPAATSISMHARRSERIAVLALTALILGGGLLPQPSVASRYRAAAALIRLRRSSPPPPPRPRVADASASHRKPLPSHPHRSPTP